MQSPPLFSAAAPKGHTLGIVPTHTRVFLQPSPSEQPPITTDPPPAVFLGSQQWNGQMPKRETPELRLKMRLQVLDSRPDSTILLTMLLNKPLNLSKSLLPEL